MTRSQPLVCTILPTYNERDNIGPLIKGVLQSAITPHLVLVVDDDSPDGTWQVVQKLCDCYATPVVAQPDVPLPPDYRALVLVRRRQEKGLTSAIQHGIDLAIHTFGAEIVTWMDCDLSMPPADVPRLVETLLTTGSEIAVGSRWIAGGADIAHGPMARRLSWIINRTAILLLGNQVRDYTSGFIAARGTVFAAIRLRGDYGEYCIDLLGRAQALGFPIREVPYVCVPRTAGESKTGANLWDYLVKGRKYVATIVRLFLDRTR